MIQDPENGEPTPENSSVRTYDLRTGSGEKLACLQDQFIFPRVGCSNGAIYVFDQNNNKLERVMNGASEDISDALPSYLKTLRYEYSKKTVFNETEWDVVLLPVSDGILMVGPAAADGSGDTFILRNDSDKCVPWAKRMSDDKVRFPAAASYRGYVYAIGTAFFEPEKEFCRRTAMDVPEYAGDIPQSPGDVPDTPGNAPQKPDPDSPVSPKTGEDNTLPLLILLLVILAGGIATVMKKKTR